MEYITIKEASEKWKIGTRIITLYCTTGRIQGAIKRGNLWLIPSYVKRPPDKRRKGHVISNSDKVHNLDSSDSFKDINAIVSSLSKNVDLFAQIFKQLPFPLTISVPDGTIVFANDAFLDFSKVKDTDNFFGKYNVFIHSDLDGWGIRDLMTRAFKGEKVFAPNLKVPRQEITKRMSGSDEPLIDTLYHDINAFPIYGDEGKLAYVISVFTMTREYRGNDEIAKGKEYIDNHWEEEFDMDKLADAVHMSKYHYLHKFKECLGITPFEYYQNIKIAKIKEKLRETNLSIAQVFADCGVNYNKGFGRVFKRLTGMTPSKYRLHIVGNSAILVHTK